MNLIVRQVRRLAIGDAQDRSVNIQPANHETPLFACIASKYSIFTFFFELHTVHLKMIVIQGHLQKKIRCKFTHLPTMNPAGDSNWNRHGLA
jgi:hypothetical protein